MLDLNLPKLNTESETNGVWFKYNDSISFKIARYGNVEYIREMLKFREEYQPLIDNKEVSEDEAKKILAEVYSRTILKDWKGIEEGDSGKLEYTIQNGVGLLSDERYRDVNEFIVYKAKESSHYYEQELNNTKKK